MSFRKRTRCSAKLAAATRDQYATATRFWKKLFGDDRRIKDLTHKFIAAKIGGYPWPSAKTHNNYLIALRGILGLEYRGAASIGNPLRSDPLPNRYWG